MKPNNRLGDSSARRPVVEEATAPAKLVEASGDLEPRLVGESLDSSYTPPPPPKHSVWRRTFSVVLLGIGLLGALLLVLHTVSANKQAALNATPVDKSAALKPQSIPLANLGLKPIDLLPESASQITVNGSVNIANSLILSPTTTPNSAVAGQLYFDGARNQLAYYNGSSYVYLLQPGSGASVTNNSVVNNITNVTNNYGTTGITAINGTAGSIAMFDGSGALTESMLTQSGSNLNTGTGVESVTIGSTSGASNTIVQGGLGNVAINTGAVSGTSGTITIESGASSTTAAGDVTVDTGESVINGTLIADKTFEDGTTDNMGDAIFGDNSGISVSTAQAHSGTSSLAVSVGSNFFPSWGTGDGTGNPPYIIRVTAGHTYALEAWVRAGTNSDTITASAIWSNDGYSGGGFISQQTFGTVTDNSSGWQKVAGVLTAPVGSYAMGFGFSSSDATSVGEVHYFDDITLTDLTTSPSEAALNLGTTNAQVITIGNSGMLAPTTIFGSGLNLSAGAGFINATSTYLSLSGSTGGSIATSTGALSLSSGTSASWGIGGALVGGSLTLHGGSSGGNNNGGDLLLQSGAGAGTGGSGNIQLTTPSGSGTAGASGSITIQTGDSPTTAAGNVNIDTGNSTVNGVQAEALDFESGIEGMGMWGGSGSVAQDCTQAHTGSCSLNITGFSSVSAWENGGDVGWAVTPGHLYAFSFWVKAASTAEPVSGAISWHMTNGDWTWSGSPTITDTSTGWTQVSWTATAPAGAQFGDFELGNINGPGTTHYFDDVVSTDMSSGSALSSLNLGTTNAQGVNIGNVSQINPTTINGGGISLSAGQGNLDISGGATTITAASDASFTSTGGVLTLSGAGGSGAGVVVVPVADSTTAFVVQRTGGAAVLSVDTQSSIVTVVNLVATGNLTVDGHLVTGGSTPTIAAGAAACTTPTVSISGNDTSGIITINTGTGCTGGGTLATITFASPFGAAPTVVLTPGSPISQTLGAYVDDSTISTTSFDLGTNATPLSSQTFKWNYFVVQ